ncbi:hypothetical protein OYE22_28545 [Streptomyces sp. 71268]|uniref:hypothetical protein n=1 Tax=Streptomyces sp. 71268 TaxID=3002640 RepID=UPI0023F799C4|nr:hypothetical protein [Streptomyces sp. 71268]WEV28692.1 hypothetical protein OYE22_28545 [Streptomyces sp. 71268]
MAVLHEQLEHSTAGVAAVHRRLDDPTDGLARVYGQAAQSRKTLEAMHPGMSELREDVQILLRRQGEVIAGLAAARAEIQQVAAALGPAHSGGGDPPAAALPPEEPTEESDFWTPAPSEGPSTDAAPHHEHADFVTATPQGEIMTDQPAPDDAKLKSEIEAAYRGAPASGQASRAGQPPSTENDPAVDHGVLLLKAAGVASVILVAHRDTWDWVAALAAQHKHWRTPAVVEDVVEDAEEDGREGRVQAVLSGRSLIAVLIQLWKMRAEATPADADFALALTTYTRIASRLAEVGEQSERGQTIRVVLDDGLPSRTAAN